MSPCPFRVSPSFWTRLRLRSNAFIARWEEGSQIVHDIVARYDGSISAEHGLGRLKTDEARRYKSPLEIATMQAIRTAIDPQRIMNPAVLF